MASWRRRKRGVAGLLFVAATLAVMVSSGEANTIVSRTKTVTGQNREIPKDFETNSNGTTSEINFSNAPAGEVTRLWVDVAINHPHLGELRLELTGPSRNGERQSVLLMNYPSVGSKDNGSSNGTGRLVELRSDFPVTFDDTVVFNGDYPYYSLLLGQDSAESEGEDGVVDDGTHDGVADRLAVQTIGNKRTDFDDFLDGPLEPIGLSKFYSKDLSGDDGRWTLRVIDGAGSDYQGTLESWTLQADVVPTPSSLVCGLGVVTFLSLYRPRRATSGRGRSSG